MMHPIVHQHGPVARPNTCHKETARLNTVHREEFITPV